MNPEIREQASQAEKPKGKSLAYVEYIISRCLADKGLRAALKRADNPATEYQSWEILAGFHVDLERESKRLPFATIGAAIARQKAERNGTVKIGQAIVRCYEGGNSNDQAKAKLRRLLACGSVREACRVLRPLLSLMDARGKGLLDYASLLDDLLWFDHEESQVRIKARWAQDFYGRSAEGGMDD